MSQKEKSSEIESRFNEKNMEKLRDSEEKQKQLRERVKTGQKFTEKELSALSIDSKEAFENFWVAALDGKVAFDKEHEHGAGRISRSANNFATSAYDFLQDISPMVELVKNFGSPYGSMAIGTVCFLFAVSKNRSRMEEQIKSTFLDIQDRLPGVAMYRHIYNDNHELDQKLQSKIADAYQSFIGFCIAALDFYTVGGCRRMLRAVQSRTEIDEQAARVQKAVVDMRLLCEELLNKNVNIVKVKLEEVQSQNIDLKRQLTELQNDRDFENLEKIRNLLGLEPFSHEAHIAQLESHRSSVAAEFQQGNYFQEKALDKQLHDVKKDPSYQEWLSSPSSRLLVLSGENHFIGASHCWVSPVALDLIENHSGITSPDSDQCAFYLLGHGEEDDLCPHVLAFFILRLLSMNKDALRNEKQFAELWTDLLSYDQLVKLPNPPVYKIQETLENIAVRTLNMFDPTKTIWIVLDRADKCMAPPGAKRSQHRKGGRALLRAIVQIIERAKPRVKALAVVNRADWHIENEADELGAEQDDSVVVRTIRQESY